jgi:transaldolase
MTRLHRLFNEQRQSPWLDATTEPGSVPGRLTTMVEAGVRGLCLKFTQAAAGATGEIARSVRLGALARRGLSAEDTYWELLVRSATEAAEVLSPVYAAGHGGDGLVSVELPPTLADDTAGTIATARSLHQQVGRPNLSVEVPATDAGVPAVRQLANEGWNVNATHIFSLDRYEQVVEAYLSGLETRPGDLSAVHGLASFSLSPVDAKVDRLLSTTGRTGAPDLRGRAAVAQAKLAYCHFGRCFGGERWEALAARGACPQRLVWASTLAESCAGTFYVDQLVGPATVAPMAEQTLSAFLHHGRVAATLDKDLEGAAQVLDRLRDAGVDMGDISQEVEEGSIAAASTSYCAILMSLGAPGGELSSS